VALWATHSPFTPLEYALVAASFSAAVRQRYRTPVYRLIRRPIVAALLFAALYPLVFLINSLFFSSGSFIARFDYAISLTGMSGLAVAIQLLIAGILAEMVSYGWPEMWGSQHPLEASPAERSLETRTSYTFALLIVALAVVLMLGDWYVATRVAREIVAQRLGDVAALGAESIPYFLESGQNLISQISEDTDLADLEGQELSTALASHMRTTPFFRQLYLLDAAGEPLGGYPVDNLDNLFLTQEEEQGIALALQGVGFQYYTAPPKDMENAAQVSFIATLGDASRGPDGVLVGRTDLATNPFTKPILQNLDSLDGIGGQGILVDEEGVILYHPVRNLVMSTYTGLTSDVGAFFDDTAPDGTRSLVYYQPTIGRPWALILTVSAQQAQTLALNIAGPLMGLLLVMATAIFIFIRPGVRFLTSSLRKLSEEANRIAEGNLDHSLEQGGVDEVGQLSGAFDQMRITLRDRLEERDRLLYVSKGVASSLDMETAVRPILESAMINGTSAAYIALPSSVLVEQNGASTRVFSTGPSAPQFAYLNTQILGLAGDREKVHLTNPARARALKVDPANGVPGSLFAIALRHENTFYGVLWTAYDEPHLYSDEEQAFLSTLAWHASQAAAKAQLFLNAEIGRQRLEAILESSPDAVLVTDHRGSLSRANAAALEILGREIVPGEELQVRDVISQPELVSLLTSESSQTDSVEFSLQDGRHFHATASPVIAEGKAAGRVCVFQDVTRYKEMAMIRSEIVENVSHDLRNPITHVKGYATFIGSVGNLNRQQTDYLEKILIEVERMNTKVSNLLDLSRLEAGGGLRIQEISLDQIVKQVVDSLQLLIIRRRHSVDVDIPPHVTRIIQADPDLIQQAIFNLVENAVKYTPVRGHITIRLREESGKVLIEVADNGNGIAPVDLPRLFERYSHVGGPEARRRHGTGLGLPIVKSIAEKHGGKAWARSQLGEGSQFFLELPIRQKRPTTNPDK
ncbi:MAG: ATP-binding protein, partial [Anaerolineales bacterium]|nr:ATP-binding protein [Anaerolineales bacterium]